MRTERQGLIALLIVVAVWGTTFPTMKLLSAQLDALQIIWRALPLPCWCCCPVARHAPHRAALGPAAGRAAVHRLLAADRGLARTSSNRNAFVTGLNVLVVPLLAMLALGRRYGWRCGPPAPWRWSA
jgi:drug/metabolite transporter (DMT)-like permease